MQMKDYNFSSNSGTPRPHHRFYFLAAKLYLGESKNPHCERSYEEEMIVVSK